MIFLLLAIISVTFILPIGTAAYYGETEVIPAFAFPGAVCIAAAAVFFIAGRKQRVSLTARDAFIVVAASWVFASILGAVPFVLSGTIPRIADAVFESVSGFTTTGATILSDIESLPVSVNLWRCQMHWLGGMGIVALTVALLPLLGVGGFQLIKAETTGPEKGKVTPKIATTAKILWFIYAGFTVIQTVLLKLAGMTWTDALAHTFSTLGTGGFSTKNQSIAYYQSASVEWICTIFMILAGVNFSLYYYAILGKFDDIRHNSELKAYLAIIGVSTAAITPFILAGSDSVGDAVRTAAFQVASIISTTGYSSADFNLWLPGAQLVIVLLMFIGGCSGSTGGGVKVVRWVILSKQMSNEVRKMLHPHGVFSIRLNGRSGRKDVVFSVAAFLFLYLLLVFITAYIAALDGTDVLSAVTASLAMVGNIGPGLGKVGPVANYGFFADGVKWWFSFAMIAGRLELYTMLIFFMPSFWKK
ncbi:cation transporter [Treponema brennaborense DSM 12168]|uniref:Cation transporter n=2 Tax=Treponema TaxID=157 RepID=F4LMU5_TREBD|nr:cation transporter [Treponema brennaborense DSM 12168]